VRILIITPYLPWPIDSGGNAAQFSTLAALQGHHLFDIVCPIKHAGLLGKVEELQRQLPHVRVRAAVLGPTPPSSKLRQRISEDFDKLESRFGWPARAFRGAARTFKHFCARALRRRLFGPSAAPSALSANAPVNVFETLPAPLLFEIAQALRDCPDLIQLEFADTLSLASWLPDHIPRVFVHHQIHWVYSERFLNSYGDNPYGRYIKNLMELQEVALLERVDAIVTFSEIDASCLRDRLDSVPVYVSPFPVPSDVSFRRDAGEPFNQKFIFLGSPAHLPNRQGAEWLLTEIWPQIAARCSDSRLQLLGQWPEALVKRWTEERIEFSGYVEDLSAAMRGTILLVPLKIGSGIRTKILAAMAQRVPVVSTTVGCEGLLATPEEDLLIGDSASDFASATVVLARDAELYERIASAGYRVVERHYSPDQVCRRRNQIYESVVRRSGG
jgi:polysaccharide biosynthesis protein PslH